MPPPKKGSDNRDVLSGLPRSRPQRPSARREKARASAAKATAKTQATVTARPKSPPRPKPPPAPKPKAPRAGYATPPPARPATQDHGLVSTAIQAAGEIVQIGATVGSQALKSALRRLPRP